eukprot:TRINITY_DN35188_c0_g1_i1.p2 TRINITY_DN35188_c0_g1~~TRINITY_DN35188_c0_g1_i1.p2  ORF type:complete len:167 (+),score=39.04 TRINITY_DN35188_c0_g1_i1:139-639(+)
MLRLCASTASLSIARLTSLPLRAFSSDADEALKVLVHQQYLTTSFVRSSGPGGQNVNKLSTKAEARFIVHQASWMPDEVRERLAAQNENRVNNAGELVVTSDETRSQSRNLKLCIARLQEMVDLACVEPRERKLFTGLRSGTKEKRIKERKARSNKKNRRSGRDMF